jgi:hypothetical protein
MRSTRKSRRSRRDELTLTAEQYESLHMHIQFLGDVARMARARCMLDKWKYRGPCPPLDDDFARVVKGMETNARMCRLDIIMSEMLLPYWHPSSNWCPSSS